VKVMVTEEDEEDWSLYQLVVLLLVAVIKKICLEQFPVAEPLLLLLLRMRICARAIYFCFSGCPCHFGKETQCVSRGPPDDTPSLYLPTRTNSTSTTDGRTIQH
jgi:hypothetical protein